MPVHLLYSVGSVPVGYLRCLRRPRLSVICVSLCRFYPFSVPYHLGVLAARPCWCRSLCRSHHLVSFSPVGPVFNVCLRWVYVFWRLVC